MNARGRSQAFTFRTLRASRVGTLIRQTPETVRKIRFSSRIFEIGQPCLAVDQPGANRSRRLAAREAGLGRT